MGASTLYFRDDDETWQQHILPGFKDRPYMTTLRFPGGELADSYDWQQHRQTNNGWPRNASTGAEQAQRTDFLELLGYAKKVGVEKLVFVVNVDDAFRYSDDREQSILRQAQHAAAWVRAVKEAGYRVDYWEIGNEPYLATSYPLTASEYAQAVRVFSTEMKKVDANIKIGAAGPLESRSIAFADLLTPQQLRKLRESKGNFHAVCRDRNVVECRKKLNSERTGEAKRWWPTLLTEAADAFDFATVHIYKTLPAAGPDAKSAMPWLTRQLSELHRLLEKRKSSAVFITVGEWNTALHRGPGAMKEGTHLVQIATQLGNFLAGDVRFVQYWPWHGPAKGFIPLVQQDDKLSSVERLLNWLASKVKDHPQFAEAVPSDGVYTLWFSDSKSRSVLLVNWNAEPEVLAFASEDMKRASVARDVPATGPAGKAIDAGFAVCRSKQASGEDRVLRLPPNSVSFLEFPA